MSTVWSHGVWTVKPGREDEFVTRWRELVPIGLEHGSADPRLLRDRDETSVFRSFGSWPDAQTLERFRDAVEDRVHAMSDVLDRFETFTLDEVHPGG